MAGHKTSEQNVNVGNYLRLVLAAALVLAVLAVVHIRTRTEVPEGCIRIENGEEAVLLRLADLPAETVRGTVVNGKGEQKEIEALGLPLLDVLILAGVGEFAEVDVIAEDEYHAVVTAEEAFREGTAYILLEDGAARLRIFGDPDSKRNVAGVERIVVR